MTNSFVLENNFGKLDKMRWICGEQYSVLVEEDLNSMINVGDLVYFYNGKLFPASRANKESSFYLNFLGVAMRKFNIDGKRHVRVATTGIFKFDCVEDCYELGNYVAPAYGIDSFENQKIEKTNKSILMVGKVFRRELKTTSVFIKIQSRIL